MVIFAIADGKNMLSVRALVILVPILAQLCCRFCVRLLDGHGSCVELCATFLQLACYILQFYIFYMNENAFRSPQPQHHTHTPHTPHTHRPHTHHTHTPRTLHTLHTTHTAHNTHKHTPGASFVQGCSIQFERPSSRGPSGHSLRWLHATHNLCVINLRVSEGCIGVLT